MAVPRGEIGSRVPSLLLRPIFVNCANLLIFGGDRGGGGRGLTPGLCLFLLLKHDKNFKKSEDEVFREPRSI